MYIFALSLIRYAEVSEISWASWYLVIERIQAVIFLDFLIRLPFAFEMLLSGRMIP